MQQTNKQQTNNKQTNKQTRPCDQIEEKMPEWGGFVFLILMANKQTNKCNKQTNKQTNAICVLPHPVMGASRRHVYHWKL